MTEFYLGRPLWYDLLTADNDAAITFYTAVVPWSTSVMESGPGSPYSMWVAPTGTVGGVMQLPDGDASPPYWRAYFGTPDVEETTIETGDLGGSVITAPFDVPDMGRFAVLRDPQGAIFAAYEPRQAPEPATRPAVGQFSWSELAAHDQAAAFAFYRELFRWKDAGAHDMGAMGTYQLFGVGDPWPLGGMFTTTPDAPTAHWLHYISVARVEAAAERVAVAGGTVEAGPMEVPGGDLIAQCRDPQGAAFALHQTAPS